VLEKYAAFTGFSDYGAVSMFAKESRPKLVKGGAEPTDTFQRVIDNGIVTGKTKRNRR
jgi:hypothetical protein